MASALTHGFAAAALGKLWTAEKMPRRFWVLGIVCSILPDLDVIGFRFGVRYGDMLGHRGFFHSLLFAAIVGAATVLVAFRNVPFRSRRWWALAAYFGSVTASHGVLDALTSGGYGIGFFLPFDATRYFFPWRPLAVSPIGVHAFFSRWGARVILSELLWIWLPMTLLLLLAGAYRRRRAASSFPPVPPVSPVKEPRNRPLTP